MEEIQSDGGDEEDGEEELSIPISSSSKTQSANGGLGYQYLVPLPPGFTPVEKLPETDAPWGQVDIRAIVAKVSEVEVPKSRPFRSFLITD